MKIDPSAFQSLEKIFHEKSRLAIVSCVAESDNGISFTELREICGLTDGNLKAHLTTLADAGIVKTKKEIYQDRARTLVSLTNAGRAQFVAYLRTLENALLAAAKSAGVAREKRDAGILSPKLSAA